MIEIKVVVWRWHLLLLQKAHLWKIPLSYYTTSLVLNKLTVVKFVRFYFHNNSFGQAVHVLSDLSGKVCMGLVNFGRWSPLKVSLFDREFNSAASPTT